MAKLADILVTLTLDTSEFSKKLKEVEKDLNSFQSQVNKSIGSMSKEVSKNTTEMSTNIEEFSKITRSSSEHIRYSTDSINKQFYKIGYSSKYISRTASTSFEDMQRVLAKAKQEFEFFGASYYHVSQQVKEQFSALPGHLQRYVQRLQDAGQSTAEFAKLNQQYSAKIIEAMRQEHEYLQTKTTQSQRLMKSFAEDTHLSPLTNGFLRISKSLEKSAKEGTALGIALKRIGKDASLKDMEDQLNFVGQGIMRAQSALIGFAVAGGLALWGMIKLAVAVDKRVVPAFESLKSTWTDAMAPFTKDFATGLINVMEFAKGIGELVKKFSEAHPVIFSMIASILLLTLVLGAFLAPLAVTGIYTQGVAASFAALWALIGPFVTGMLAVIGVAMALATAIVAVYVAVQNMWDKSEAFRQACTALWEGIKSAIVTNFVTPVLKSWDNLISALVKLVSKFTGGTKTIGELWTWLGDKLAIVVNAISKVTLPLVSKAFELLGDIVTGVIDLLVEGVNWLAKMWEKHGDSIKKTVKQLWGYIEVAFNAVSDFLKEISPQLTQIVSSAFELIKTAVKFTMDYIVPAVVAGFQWIWDKIGWIMPIVVYIIKDTWDNIKSLITNTLNLVQNVIELFTNLLQGNWSGAWENVKQIVKSALALLWDWINLWILGKILKVFKGLGGKVKSALGDLAEKMAQPFKKGYDKVKGWVDKVLGLVNSMKESISGAWDNVTGFFGGGSGKSRSSGSSGSSGSGSGGNINANARGNVFNGASLLGGNQLVGEAGAEVVMPIERKRYMKPYASMVAGLLSNGTGASRGEGIVQNITINSTTPLSPTEVARKNLQVARRLAIEWEV